MTAPQSSPTSGERAARLDMALDRIVRESRSAIVEAAEWGDPAAGSWQKSPREVLSDLDRRLGLHLRALAVAPSAPEPSEAAVIATALYRHRYPRSFRALTEADRDHPSLGRIFREADAVCAALAARSPAETE
jgi:hypothetical protein